MVGGERWTVASLGSELDQNGGWMDSGRRALGCALWPLALACGDCGEYDYDGQM